MTSNKHCKDRDTKLRSESRTGRSGMNTTKREKVMETKRKKWMDAYSKDINQIMRKKQNEWYFNEKGKKRTDRLTGRLSAA